MDLRFSGHETFIARTFWPKKGYDFIKSKKKFSDKNTVVELGVGKNMVSSIQFWMKAFGLLNEKDNSPTEFADFIFGENGTDPFLEDIATIWLLHYHLVKTNYSTIYNFIFNDLRAERAIFNKQQLISFINRKYSEIGNNSFNSNTINKDISVFDRLYKKLDYSSVSGNFEEEINSVLLELELINTTVEEKLKEGSNKKEKIEWYHLHGEYRNNLPAEIVLFSILDNFQEAKNVAFRRLQTEPNSPGMVFLLSKDGLFKKLKEIEVLYSEIMISETAGNVVLSIPEGLNKWDILRNYYAD